MGALGLLIAGTAAINEQFKIISWSLCNADQSGDDVRPVIMATADRR
jgi:hypothetical protein